MTLPTAAELTTVPAPRVLTATETVATPPGGRVAKSNRRRESKARVGAGSDEMNVVLAGRALVRRMPTATPGPWLETTMVKVTISPRPTDSGEANISRRRLPG